MSRKNRNEQLLAALRNGMPLSRNQKLNLIVGLSIPSILAQVTSILMFFIDASMVGHLGARASASIGLVEPTTWLIGSLTSAASLGFSVQAAHFIGASDFDKARDVFRHGIVFTTLLSVVLTVLAFLVAGPLPYWLGGGADIAHDGSLYFMVFSSVLPFFQLQNLCNSMLKSSGDMRVPSMVSILMCVLDVVFNYFFIYIAGLGVLGAALGTVVAVIVSALLSAWFAVFRNKIIGLWHHRAAFTLNTQYLVNAMRLSAPMAFQSVLMTGAQTVSIIIVAPLGNYAIAANMFAVTAESLCYMPGYGIGDAATTLVGQSVGARRFDMCRSFAYMTVFIGMAVMAFMGVVMFIFAHEMIGILSPVEQIRSLGAESLRIEAFAEPMFAASIVAYSVFVGAGDTLKPALINLCSMWLVRLTLAALLAPCFGLPGVWTAMAVELTFRGVMFLIRLFRGRWIEEAKKLKVATPYAENN